MRHLIWRVWCWALDICPDCEMIYDAPGRHMGPCLARRQIEAAHERMRVLEKSAGVLVKAYQYGCGWYGQEGVDDAMAELEALLPRAMDEGRKKYDEQFRRLRQ